MYQSVFDYISGQEQLFQTQTVPVTDGYDFSFFETVKTATMYRDGKLTTGNDENKPVRNIVRPIRNLQIRAEGFDVKDILPFVNSGSHYYKSLLVRKKHQKWARENDLDTFIDEMVESYVDYGLSLIKKGKESVPEVVKLQTIAFCDQTDILSGPICLKHYYSPDQLKDMEESGWENVDDVIALSRENKTVAEAGGMIAQTPGKFIEVYELDGTFPVAWLKDEPSQEDWEKYSRQFHLVTFYKDEKGNQQGLRLFRGKGDKGKYKAIKRDAVHGRALGIGCIEELFEPQVWTTYNMILMKRMLDKASLIIHQTADQTLKGKTRIDDLANELIVHQDGKPITQVQNVANIQAFENAITMWERHAQVVGSANEAVLGASPTSGTPFKLQELVTQENYSLHNYRRGKLATFLGEIYRDWILPRFAEELSKGDEFMADLTPDEMRTVAEAIVTNEANRRIKERILSGNPDFTQLAPEYLQAERQQIMDEFGKGGARRFFSIAKGEFESLPIDVEVNIAGKQKALSAMTDKLVQIFREVVRAPQILQTPQMAQLFNQILESSGLESMDFTNYQPQLGQAPQPGSSPAQADMQQLVAA